MGFTPEAFNEFLAMGGDIASWLGDDAHELDFYGRWLELKCDPMARAVELDRDPYKDGRRGAAAMDEELATKYAEALADIARRQLSKEGSGGDDGAEPTES